MTVLSAIYSISLVTYTDFMFKGSEHVHHNKHVSVLYPLYSTGRSRVSLSLYIIILLLKLSRMSNSYLELISAISSTYLFFLLELNPF